MSGDLDFDFDEDMSLDDHNKNMLGDFEPLPEGQYDLVCDKAEWLDSKNKPENSYLKLQWSVCEDGDFHNRKIFQNLNLINTNDTAKKMAQAQLKQIMASSGWEEKRAPRGSEVPGMIVRAHVVLGNKQVGGKNDGKYSNEIKEFIAGATSTAPIKTTESKGKDASQPW